MQLLLTDGALAVLYVPLIGGAMAVAKLFEVPGQSSTWYPPAGLTLAFFVLTSRKNRWRAFVLAAVARIVFDLLLYGSSVGREITHAVVVLGVYLAVSFTLDRIDASDGDVVQLGRAIVMGALVAPLLAAVASAAVNALFATPNSFVSERTFAIGDAIGVATVYPLLRLAHRRLQSGPTEFVRHRSLRTTELAAQIAALLVIPTVAVAVGHDRHAGLWAFAMLPVLWVALRRSMIVASAAVLLGNVVLATASRLWLGPTDSLVEAQIVLLASTLAAGYVSTIVRRQQHRGDERVARERSSAAIARTDLLTKLPNRIGLLHHLRGEDPTFAADTSLVFGPGSALSVIVMDIERFAEVIDGLGSGTGDAILVSVGQRLTNVVRTHGVVSRLEGDTFAVALSTGDVSIANQIAHDALTAITAVPYSEGLGLYLAARAGIATEASVSDPDDVVRNAAIALHTAKVGRHRRPVVFENNQRVQALENRTLLSALRYAIDHDPDQLGLAYQPIFDARDRSLLGAEALLRWQHPGLGFVSPARFIPLAEHSGLMLELGDLVLRKAVDQVGRWNGLVTRRDLHLHVNVSPTQLADEQLPIRLAHACKAASVLPEQITLELTESALGLDPHESMAMLERLRTVGARLCLDDFGTGYSTIGWLSRFPIDELKVDQSFVAGLPSRSDDVAITKLIFGLARELSLDVTAEGVENVDQLAALIEMGCERAQGYLLSKPLPAASFQSLLVASSSLDA
jgi:diguanylate cyclase (GGDEF)-like protein